MEKINELENYYKVVDHRQNLIVFSDDTDLKSKDIRRITEYLEGYGNSVDTFILCSKKTKLKNNLHSYFDLDVSEKEVHCGKSSTNISELLKGCYEPIVIFACGYSNDLDRVSSKIIGQNCLSTIILVGKKEIEEDIRIREEAQDEMFDYVAAKDDLVPSIIDVIVSRRINHFKEPITLNKPIVKVFTDKK